MNTRGSAHDLFQVLGVHFNCGVLIDHFERENKSQSVTPSYEHTLHTFHRTALDANFLADSKLQVRLHVSTLHSRAQQFYFRIRYRHVFTVVADNVDHSGRLENLGSLVAGDMNEQIGRKKGKYNSNTLPVPPHFHRLISWEKRFYLSQCKLSYDRLFVLRKRENGVPLAFR